VTPRCGYGEKSDDRSGACRARALRFVVPAHLLAAGLRVLPSSRRTIAAMIDLRSLSERDSVRPINTMAMKADSLDE
jgi:hypothetical protein